MNYQVTGRVLTHLDLSINLDNTRMIHHIEYDQITDRHVGFCLPLKDSPHDAMNSFFKLLMR